MASIQATRLKKGMLIKIGADLFRVLELQHVTPGQPARLRAREVPQHPQRIAVRPEAALGRRRRARRSLDEREMQYLYRDGDAFHFMDTSIVRAAAHRRRSARRHRSNYLIPDALIKVEFYGERAGRHRAAADGRSGGRRHGARASRARPPAPRSSRRASRPASSCNVPPFVNTGDKVRVSTETGEYLSRA